MKQGSIEANAGTVFVYCGWSSVSEGRMYDPPLDVNALQSKGVFNLEAGWNGRQYSGYTIELNMISLSVH